MTARIMWLPLVPFFVFAGNAGAENWPAWRGPDRSDVSKETGLLATWPEQGPELVWLSKKSGVGYAGFAVVDENVYTMGAYKNDERLICLDAATGDVRWRMVMTESVLENGWGDGPRGTPTVDGEFIYAMAGDGTVVCAKAATGDLVWKINMQDLGGKVPNWGYTESVLVDGDRVVFTPGGADGALVAVNKLTGEKIWQSKDFTDSADYSSVIVAEHDGVRQYIQLTQKTLVGIAADDGRVLWTYPWPGRIAVVPTPIFRDGKVYIACGYGVGCGLVKITKDSAEEVYENKIMKNHHGGVILVGDHLYGYSDGLGWVCQDFETGEQVWAEKNALGKGAIACADGMLYCVDEGSGEVVLIEASPQGWNEKGRFKLDPQSEFRSPRGKIWTHPTIANGKLYLRDQEIVYCFNIKK
ncbi:PQQ-like beta-propeller repeat protein [bacterium]|nr:PQQ-like beta-propeller repeat protein [bacterium]MDC0307173.1 PQQ-like beta-propeller repeat protein [bacterium]